MLPRKSGKYINFVFLGKELEQLQEEINNRMAMLKKELISK